MANKLTHTLLPPTHLVPHRCWNRVLLSRLCSTCPISCSNTRSSLHDRAGWPRGPTPEAEASSAITGYCRRAPLEEGEDSPGLEGEEAGEVPAGRGSSRPQVMGKVTAEGYLPGLGHGSELGRDGEQGGGWVLNGADQLRVGADSGG